MQGKIARKIKEKVSGNLSIISLNRTSNARSEVAIDTESRHFMREKRTPLTALVSIQNHVRRVVPEPEVLKTIGEESVQKGTHILKSRRIDQIIRAARFQKNKT